VSVALHFRHELLTLNKLHQHKKMKKQVSKITLALAFFSSVAGFSQENQHIIPCATYQAMELQFKADPSARQRFEDAQRSLQQSRIAMENNPSARPAAVQYTIPVVFHVLHMGGPENIPDATCIQALDQINKDYARASADT
jgi:hypothetical protein